MLNKDASQYWKQLQAIKTLSGEERRKILQKIIKETQEQLQKQPQNLKLIRILATAEYELAQISTPEEKRKLLEESLKHAKRGLEIAEQLNDLSWIIKLEHCVSVPLWELATMTGNVSERRKLFEESLKHKKRGLEIAEQLNDLSWIIRLEYGIGGLFWELAGMAGSADERRKLLEESLKHFKRGLEIAEQLNDLSWIVKLEHGISFQFWELAGMAGSADERRKLLEESLKHARHGLEIAEQLNDLSWIITLDYNIGISLWELAGMAGSADERRKLLEESLKHAKRGLEIAEQLNDLMWIVRLEYNIGGTFRELAIVAESSSERRRLLEESLKHARHGLEIAEQLDDLSWIVKLEYIIGTSLEKLARITRRTIKKRELLEESLRYFTNSLEIAEKLGDLVALSYLYWSCFIGKSSLFELGVMENFKEIISLCERGARCFYELGRLDLAAEVLRSGARFVFRVGDVFGISPIEMLRKALEWSRKSVEFAQKYGVIVSRVDEYFPVYVEGVLLEYESMLSEASKKLREYADIVKPIDKCLASLAEVRALLNEVRLCLLEGNYSSAYKGLKDVLRVISFSGECLSDPVMCIYDIYCKASLKVVECDKLISDFIKGVAEDVVLVKALIILDTCLDIISSSVGLFGRWEDRLRGIREFFELIVKAKGKSIEVKRIGNHREAAKIWLEVSRLLEECIRKKIVWGIEERFIQGDVYRAKAFYCVRKALSVVSKREKAEFFREAAEFFGKASELYRGKLSFVYDYYKKYCLLWSEYYKDKISRRTLADNLFKIANAFKTLNLVRVRKFTEGEAYGVLGDFKRRDSLLEEAGIICIDGADLPLSYFDRAVSAATSVSGGYLDVCLKIIDAGGVRFVNPYSREYVELCEKVSRYSYFDPSLCGIRDVCCIFRNVSILSSDFRQGLVYINGENYRVKFKKSIINSLKSIIGESYELSCMLAFGKCYDHVFEVEWFVVGSEETLRRLLGELGRLPKFSMLM